MPPVALRAHRAHILPLVSVLLALVMLVAGAIGLLGRNATPVEYAEIAKKPAVSAVHGVGYSFRGQWIGTWRTADGIGFCIEFDKAHPNSSGVKPVGKTVPGMSADQSTRVRYVTNTYGSTRSKVDGAAAAIYVWKVQDTDRFDRYYAKLVKDGLVSSAIRKRVAEIGAEAKNHGPYTLRMTMGSGYVGQSVKGQVTVRAANGKGVKGMRVALATNGNGTVTKQDRSSDASGRIAFTARVTRLGALRVNATLSVPGPGIWVTQPTAGRQRLVLAGKQTTTAKATVASERRIGAPTVSSVCDSDCNGAAPVMVRMANPCGSLVLREFVYRDGNRTPVAVVDVAPCRTASASVTLPDNAHVTTAFCYLNAQKACIAAPKANAGSLRVVCPPGVEFRFSGACPCTDVKRITYAVLAPAGSVRKFTVTMVRTGPSGPRTTHTVVLRNGAWTPLPAVTLSRGDNVQLSVSVLGKTRIVDSVIQAA
jgi:hypothetical protein